MYIQVTTKCQLQCAHCCFSCRPGRGKHMPKYTFDACVKLLESRFDEECVTLGGGEPTLHPEIFSMLGQILAVDIGISAYMVTNGENHKIVKGLLGLTGRRFSMRLSKTQYHFGNWDLTKEFKEHNQEVTCNFDYKPYAAGRARHLPEAKKGCVCTGFFVNPNGVLKLCGCPRSPVLGNVNEFWINDRLQQVLNVDGFLWGECYKAQPLEVLKVISTF